MEESRFFKRNLLIAPIGGIRIACFVRNGKGVLTPRRSLPHYTLVYVTRGGGHYRDETGFECEVKAGDAILVFPGREHWYGPPPGGQWDEFYLVFEGPVFDMWRDTACFDAAKPVITLNPMEFWRDRIMQVIGGGPAESPDELLREAVRVQGLLADVQKAAHEDIEGDLLWMERAKAALVQTLEPKDAAVIVGQSYEAFRKKFKRLAGVSPGKYATGLLMEQACELLTEGDFLMREIAERLGYCDEYHFSRQFSKTIGWSPSEYRARLARNKSDAGLEYAGPDDAGLVSSSTV